MSQSQSPISSTSLPAIVVAAWNRLESLDRLLTSLQGAIYPNEEINLIISIDGGGPASLQQLANNFQWKYGPKEVITHSENLGLVRHLLSCGDLSLKYGSICLLEDDLEVAVGFYLYGCKALDYYRNHPRINGVSLYSHSIAESSSWYAFEPLPEQGSDVYFLNYPVSWGQLWTAGWWEGFRTWAMGNEGSLESAPGYSHLWGSETWKRDLLRYMIQSQLYFVAPKEAYSTNTGAPGVHFKETDDRFGVPLSPKTQDWKFIDIEGSCNRFDAWFEPELDCLQQFCPEIPDQTVVDLYGTKTVQECKAQKGEMVLSSFPVAKAEKSWRLESPVFWRSLQNSSQGKGLFLGPVSGLKKGKWQRWRHWQGLAKFRS